MSLSQREKEFLDKYLPGFSDKGRSNADASKIKNNVVIDDI